MTTIDFSIPLKVSDTLFSLLSQTGSNSGTLVPRKQLKDVSKHFNDGIQHDLPWELLLVGLGSILIIIVAVSMRRWWVGRHDDPSPLVLYSAISRKAGLSWADRFLLWRIARANALPTPITLLLARGSLRHYASTFASGLSTRSAQRLRQRITRIEAELFG